MEKYKWNILWGRKANIHANNDMVMQGAISLSVSYGGFTNKLQGCFIGSGAIISKAGREACKTSITYCFRRRINKIIDYDD